MILGDGTLDLEIYIHVIALISRSYFGFVSYCSKFLAFDAYTKYSSWELYNWFAG